ncbi:hypothetical protein G7054_g14297 [Neopestalotiopsis clavispora]|nr:hypothetical protein G7054_g14297 [Neopestalotiopsis clavispora]
MDSEKNTHEYGDSQDTKVVVAVEGQRVAGDAVAEAGLLAQDPALANVELGAGHGGAHPVAQEGTTTTTAAAAVPGRRGEVGQEGAQRQHEPGSPVAELHQAVVSAAGHRRGQVAAVELAVQDPRQQELQLRRRRGGATGRPA